MKNQEKTATQKRFYPCIENSTTGKVNVRVGPLMSQEDARTFLETRCRSLWLKCEAVPRSDKEDTVEVTKGTQTHKNMRLLGLL